jgi:hypothetical protein
MNLPKTLAQSKVHNWLATQAQNIKYDLYKEDKTPNTHLTNNEGSKTRHYSIHINIRQ